jgi:K+-sensing histidine kinase KdpD
MVLRYRRPLNVIFGTALSALVAVAASLFFARSSWRGFLPLAFVVVLVLLAGRFGVAVSLTGSMIAALIFSLMLFSPIGSMKIESDSARMSLGWMIIGSVALSYLFYPSHEVGDGRRRRD